MDYLTCRPSAIDQVDHNVLPADWLAGWREGQAVIFHSFNKVIGTVLYRKLVRYPMHWVSSNVWNKRTCHWSVRAKAYMSENSVFTLNMLTWVTLNSGFFARQYPILPSQMNNR